MAADLFPRAPETGLEISSPEKSILAQVGSASADMVGLIFFTTERKTHPMNARAFNRTNSWWAPLEKIAPTYKQWFCNSAKELSIPWPLEIVPGSPRPVECSRCLWEVVHT